MNNEFKLINSNNNVYIKNKHDNIIPEEFWKIF